MCLKSCPFLEKLSRGASLYICSIFIVLKYYLIKNCIEKIITLPRSKTIAGKHDVTEEMWCWWSGRGINEYDEMSHRRITSEFPLPMYRTFPQIQFFQRGMLTWEDFGWWDFCSMLIIIMKIKFQNTYKPLIGSYSLL